MNYKIKILAIFPGIGSHYFASHERSWRSAPRDFLMQTDKLKNLTAGHNNE